MVDYLKLPTTTHENPYKLQWLNEYAELKVTRQIVIRFKVGNYKDKVLCDIIPMQACHLLVGRPWQYNRSIKYDGRTKHYSFEFVGQNFTLHPLSPSELCEAHQQIKGLKGKGRKEKKPESGVSESKSGKGEGVEGVPTLKCKKAMVILSRKRDLFKEYDDTTPILLLAHVFYTNLSTSSIPPSIYNILQELEDVIPNELLQGLPPLRGIEHQIDFVLGSQFPNKPAYRSNLTNTKDLQRQVEELLNKEYIKESMSPYAVSVLLVPNNNETWFICVY
ncbi:uncharacterized protein LOC107879067 [Capsicum annuum]|uniref:uncharacterized protein LOC107879067 n=1 Tax=Capsicum annuum TaxID=4072 RepID=UPI0007BF2973|nr:uncharacterized protein LOC107879067 [Capsicum annuum]